MRKRTLVINAEGASQVTGGWQYARQRDFTGGETLAKLPEMVRRNQLIRMENAIVSPGGEITESWQMDVPLFVNVSGGLVIVPIPNSDLATVYGTTAVGVISFTFDPSSPTPYDMAAASGYNDYAIHAHAAVVITGISHGTPFLGKNYCVSNQGVYNLTDNVFIASGALVGKTPVKLRQYDNRLWAVCSDGSLVFSNNGDANTWDALNIILLPNREPMIDFLPVQAGVILTSRTSAYAMYGSGVYTDTSILPIQDGSAPGSRLMLSDSAVVVDSVAYVLGNKGVHSISLNGMKEIPHDQTEFFKSRYTAWNSLTQPVQGIYLYRFHAILYLFQNGYGAQGFLYYIHNGAFCKIDQSLPSNLPYMLELFDANVDFLFGTGDGTTVCRSTYPAGILAECRTAIVQTRHEDADSTREKIWRHLGLTVEKATSNVFIQAFLDYSETPEIIPFGIVDLVEGDNIIDLFNDDYRYLRSKTISIKIEVGGSNYLMSDTNQVLMSGNEPLTSGDPPTDAVSFAIREIRLKYCEVGAAE